MAPAVMPVADGIATVRIPPQVQTATAAPAAPGQDKVVVYINHPAEDLGQNPDSCACTTGWLFFGLGWAFWPLWFAGALLPLCDKVGILHVLYMVQCMLPPDVQVLSKT